MAGAGQSAAEQVNVFEVDERYLFKHYFNGDDVFARLQPYYNHNQYRFEVPAKAFEDLQGVLADHGYELVVVDSLGKYVVVVEQYTAHPEDIFADSVVQRSVEGYNCFLVTDQYAVANAVAEGAMRLQDTELPNPFR